MDAIPTRVERTVLRKVRFAVRMPLCSDAPDTWHACCSVREVLNVLRDHDVEVPESYMWKLYRKKGEVKVSTPLLEIRTVA